MVKCNIRIFILVSLLAGCSTYSKSQCNQFDWQKQGAKHAEYGWTFEGSKDHFQHHCTLEHEIPVDQTALKKGYQRGLKNFCTPGNAQVFASKGGVYQNTCPANLEKSFLKPYTEGMNIHYTNKIEALEDEIQFLQQRISELEAQNAELSSRSL